MRRWRESALARRVFGASGTQRFASSTRQYFSLTDNLVEATAAGKPGEAEQREGDDDRQHSA